MSEIKLYDKGQPAEAIEALRHELADLTVRIERLELAMKRLENRVGSTLREW